MRQSLVQRLSTAFALLALVVLLAFGGGIRYLCYCTGEVVVTVHEHCHGHDDADHHHEDSPSKEEDHGDHDHELVKSPTDLRLPSNPGTPELKWVPLAWTPLVAVNAICLSPAEAGPAPVSTFHDPPPPAPCVTRSVVFLI